MKTNKEILDEFGKRLVNDVFDDSLGFINNDLKDLKETPEFKNLFEKMNDLEFTEMKLYTKEVLTGALFKFLQIFEDNDEFKIYFTSKNQKVNLNEISEMLKAEPIIENGWINRFSKEIDDEK